MEIFHAVCLSDCTQRSHSKHTSSNRFFARFALKELQVHRLMSHAVKRMPVYADCCEKRAHVLMLFWCSA